MRVGQQEENRVPSLSSDRRLRAAETETDMARLTDSQGVLLGGLNTGLDRLSDARVQTQAAAILAPAATPLPMDFEPGEIVFALSCSYGSLPCLGYSAAPVEERLLPGRRPPQTRGCDTLVEMPEERHYCPSCGGYYCAAHAAPTAHDCKSVMRAN